MTAAERIPEWGHKLLSDFAEEPKGEEAACQLPGNKDGP